jgi:CarboxypepD_reg-like domain
MKLKLILFLFSLIALNILAQTGTIKGRVVDKEFSEPLIGANVIILNTTLGAATDINGFFEIRNIHEGLYSLKVSFIGYNSEMNENIKIGCNDTLYYNFWLKPDTTSQIEIITKKFKVINKTACTFRVPVDNSVEHLPIRGISDENQICKFLDSIKTLHFVPEDSVKIIP